MAKIELKVADPKALDRGENSTATQMTYGDTGSPIVIDTETAFIECEAQGKSASIKDWDADFDSHKMKLSEDASDGNYSKIDQTTAVGIVGQLVKEVGISTLQTLLTTLIPRIYGAGESTPPSPSGSDIPAGDVPAETPPEMPKESEMPGPVNTDEL